MDPKLPPEYVGVAGDMLGKRGVAHPGVEGFAVQRPVREEEERALGELACANAAQPTASHNAATRVKCTTERARHIIKTMRDGRRINCDWD